MLVVAEDQRAREMVCILYILIFHLLLALASLWPPLTWKVQPKKMALILLAQYFSKSFKKILVGCWKQFIFLGLPFAQPLHFVSVITLCDMMPLCFVGTDLLESPNHCSFTGMTMVFDHLSLFWTWWRLCHLLLRKERWAIHLRTLT